MIIKILFHIFSFSLVFTILYFESYSIGGIKFSLIWKLPVMLLMLVMIYIVYNKRSKTSIPRYIITGYLLNFKQLINVGLFYYPLMNFIMAFQFMLLPLIWHYLLIINIRKYYSKIINYLYYLSQYLILSSVPILLHIVEPLKEGVKMRIPGMVSFGFIGVFQRPHSASIAIASALLVIIFFQVYKKRPGRFRNIFTWMIIIIGLYVLYATYVRTGWLMLFIGLFVMISIGKSFKLYVFKAIPIFLILIGALIVFVSTNEALQNRLFDIRENQVNSSLEERIGSGRLEIAKATLIGWSNSGIPAILIGNGTTLSAEKTAEVLGIGLFSHNGFLDILVTNGIIGLFILLVWFYYIYKYIEKYKDVSFYRLAKAFFFMFMSYFITQGGINYIFIILFAFILVLLNYEKNLKVKKNGLYCKRQEIVN